MRVAKLLLPLVVLLIFNAGVLAQETTPEATDIVAQPVPTSYAWVEANLGLLMPVGWNVQAGSSGENLILTLNPLDEASNAFFQMIVTPAAEYPPSRLSLLDEALAQHNLFGYSTSNTGWFGDNALAITLHNSLDGIPVEGRVGRLPDHRIVYAFGTSPDFAPIANHVTLDDTYLPETAGYSLAWSAQIPEFGVVIDTLQPRVAGVTASSDRVFAVNQQGVIEFDLNGALVGTYPFLNPSTPTGIAIGIDGNLYVGDTVCRCLQVLGRDRRWANPVGSFGANAPESVFATSDGAIYAVDRTENTYLLSTSTGGRERTFPLNFNATAAPIAGASASEILVVEWLQSLIDNSVAGAVSSLDTTSVLPELKFWLPYSPAQVIDVAVHPEGWLAVALNDGSIMRADTDGALTPLASDLPGISTLNFTPDGALIAGWGDGSIGLANTSAPANRVGNETIVPFAPVLGSLSERMTGQRWHFAGEAGQIITLAATDLQRRDTLDMALSLVSPSGAVVAENDDQQGVALWGSYDAYIPSFTLPESGIYGIDVTRIGGDGTYALALTVDRTFALEDQAITLTGALSDVIPVDRWVFQGQRGQIITVTLRAESGDLDPLLTIMLSDGRPLARNDDAADTELGTGAQLFRIELPRDDTYILEASRFDFTGAGNYSMLVFSG